jgi:hypothetical protein
MHCHNMSLHPLFPIASYVISLFKKTVVSVLVQQLSYRLSSITDYFFCCVQTSSEVHPTSHSTGAYPPAPDTHPLFTYLWHKVILANYWVIQLHISLSQWVWEEGGGGCMCSFFSGRAAKLETEHLSISSAKFKNEWTRTSMCPFAFVACTGTPLPLPLILNWNLKTIILGFHAP